MPCHMITDVNGFCLVVEHGGSKRVVMLDNELRFVKELIPESIGLGDPMRICFDRKQERLFVAEYFGAGVIAFDLTL